VAKGAVAGPADDAGGEEDAGLENAVMAVPADDKGELAGAGVDMGALAGAEVDTEVEGDGGAVEEETRLAPPVGSGSVRAFFLIGSPTKSSSTRILVSETRALAMMSVLERQAGPGLLPI
jgi:hypothetical protein